MVLTTSTARPSVLALSLLFIFKQRIKGLQALVHKIFCCVLLILKPRHDDVVEDLHHVSAIRRRAKEKRKTVLVRELESLLCYHVVYIDLIGNDDTGNLRAIPSKLGIPLGEIYICLLPSSIKN